MNRLLIGAVGIALLISVTGFFSYKAGGDAEKAKDLKAITKYQQKIKGLIDDLESANQKRKVIYRDKIIKIKQANSACADLDIDESIAKQLQ